MMSRPFLRGSVAVLLAAAGWLGPSEAQAAMCSQSSDCPKGFACQVVGVSACASPACPPGARCPAPPPCDPQMITACAPLPCTTNSDCATGMVCFTQSIQSCPPSAVPSCPPNTKCPVVTPAPCTSMTTSSCVPQYELPCHVDSDCGSGFTCVPDVVGSCSGSGGVASADGGFVAPPPPVCTTMTLSTSSCSAKTVNCSANADCPSGWTCVAPLQAATGVADPGCATPAPDPAIDAGTALPPACNPGPTPIPQNPQKQCAPPYSDLAGYGPGRSASGTGGSSESSPAPVSATGGAGDPASKNGTNAASSEGCQLGSGTAAGGGAAWLALFGLVGLAWRRRQTVDQPASAKRR